MTDYKLQRAKMILEEYKKAINPIMDHFESASTKSLYMRRGNMLTPEEYSYIDQRIAEAESVLRGILNDYEDLMYEALDEKEDLQ
jgi:hypothetical protein